MLIEDRWERDLGLRQLVKGGLILHYTQQRRTNQRSPLNVRCPKVPPGKGLRQVRAACDELPGLLKAAQLEIRDSKKNRTTRRFTMWFGQRAGLGTRRLPRYHALPQFKKHRFQFSRCQRVEFNVRENPQTKKVL